MCSVQLEWGGVETTSECSGEGAGTRCFTHDEMDLVDEVAIPDLWILLILGAWLNGRMIFSRSLMQIALIAAPGNIQCSMYAKLFIQ